MSLRFSHIKDHSRQHNQEVHVDSRRVTVPDHSFAHVYFRCHDQKFFLEPEHIKVQLLVLLAKYKAAYRIKIFDFCIMDNHAHLYLWTPSSLALGNYMRTVLSQTARLINDTFDRDSQAFRERYQSRVILGDSTYSINLIKYIYANRYVVGKPPPDQDYFCSAHWRLHKPHSIIPHPSTTEEENNNHLAKLLDDYSEVRILPATQEEGFTMQMVEDAMRDSQEERELYLFVTSHTIGSPEMVEFRNQVIRAARRDRSKPELGVGTSSHYPSPPAPSTSD
jgi:REP element-mobilizing transposase RayT